MTDVRNHGFEINYLFFLNQRLVTPKFYSLEWLVNMILDPFIKQKVAVLIPYETYKKSHSKIKLGILSNKSKYKICDDFELTDDEFLGL